MSVLHAGAAFTVAALLALVPLPQTRAAGGAPEPDVARELAHAHELMDRKDWTAALVELKRALRKDRRNPDVHNLMGFSYRKSGQLDDAFDSHRAALRLDPLHRGAHEYIGQAYLQANQPDKAREHLATLKRICGDCEEYQDLAKAVSSWHPPSSAASTTATAK
jgi:Flp pilus assembly protein TadD